MFDSSIYQQRRKKLKQEVQEGLILLLGNDQSAMNYAGNHYPFRQDSTFLYYSGIDHPQMALILDLDNDQEILFGRNPSIDDIIWTGPVPSLDDYARRAGIHNKRAYKKLDSFLDRNNNQSIHYIPPYRPEHILKIQRWLGTNQDETTSQCSEVLIQAIINQRTHKTEAEIHQMEEAISISIDMHLAAMKAARPGMDETEIMSIVHQQALAQGGRPAFTNILTKDGQTLHNTGYSETIEEGNLILCDAGAENTMHYGGDLTRTFPAGRQFTNLQKEMYQIVLNAQLKAVEKMAPGVLFKDVHLTACRSLVEGLKSMGLMKGNPEDAVHVGAHTLFFQCGLGHLLGLDTHDMENLGEQRVGYGPHQQQSDEFGLKSLRLGRALEPGFVVTVEPGIYIIPELIDLRKSENKYMDFINYGKLEHLRDFGGIRIEDDYLITEDSSALLGPFLPKKANEVEQIRTESLS